MADDLRALKEAAAAVKHSPHAVSAWEEVEGLAADLERPDDVVALYNETLAGSLEAEVAEMIGERAGAFCDEWFGDAPDTLEKILRRVSALAPASDSALQRLSVIYTVAERWNDALALYDGAIDTAKDKHRRVKLLREAAQLAKDVANQPDKAIGYYQRLLPLVPEDAQVGQSLERLLERHERWEDLINLWEGRLEGQSKRERERGRARIAACWLDNLHDPQRALAAARPLLAEADDDTEPCALLERVIESTHATKAVRENALELLRTHHDQAQRPREVIRILEKVIALDPASRELREEAGARLAELDDLPAAMDHYAALLAMDPTSNVVEEKLRVLAERGGLHDRYAVGLAAAARVSADPTRRVELLGEAARTRLDRLEDVAATIELLVEASSVAGAQEHEQLGVARKLAALYAQTNRPKERLAMLERQAHVEPNDAARAAILGEAAKLAETLGDTERALSLWERRIDSDPNDLSGLDARIAILESQQRWDELVASLESRAAKLTSPVQKRADLVRVALVHHQQRRDLNSAIGAWQRVVADHADDEEGISALADLLAETGRWKEMADLLEGASGRATSRTIGRLVRLGDALREHLGEPVRALAGYRNAIAIDPGSKPARHGLTALLDEQKTRAGAADALAQAMRTTGDVTGVLELLPARLAEAHDDRTRLALLREAAQLRLEKQHDSAGALADLARAFPLAPRDQLIENQIVSLGTQTGDHATVAKAYEEAIAALGAQDAREAARLRFAYANIVHDHLRDVTRAATAFEQVASVEPGNRRAVHSFAGLGTSLGMWEDAASTVVRYASVREAFDDELLSILEVAAGKESAWDRLATALDAALAKHKLPSAVAATFHQRLAALHRDHRKDRVAAIASLRKALELGGERTAWLSDLVAMEREQGASPQLLDALRRLADADGRDLDSLVGSADVASKLGEREQALQILSAVLGRATAAWRGTASIRSARSVDAVAKWAIDGLVDLYRTGGRARAAVDTLVEAARLPFDATTRRDLRLRAAQLATVELGDNAAAIDMYRSVLASAPNDVEVIERLAHLLAVEDRVPELLTLRQIQLGLPGLDADLDKKLALRLELARLVGVIEERGGRLDALKANLQDRAGHEASIDAVSDLLASKGQHKSLADLLEQQAQRLEAETDAPRAARLWARYAQVTEKDTREIERAISGHRRVVALAPTSDSLRALARLNLERSQPAQAVPWLESLLGTVTGSERLQVVSQLAKAHLSAHQPDRAIQAIEGNLDDSQGTQALELRTMLADLYRKAEMWEPLARHLTRSLPQLKDEKLSRDFAREASTIYLNKLGSPAKAIPALETALALDPTDKEIRTYLAVGQRVAGRLVEARAGLSELINDFGRRRSPERATLHVELARVAQAEGKIDEAMTEMEAASKMDVNNAGIQKELAEMARAAGQLDKAERTYRALLLVVRRSPPGDDENAVGPSEVLFELHQLAASRKENEQAKELLESAMEAATQSDAEVRRLRRSLLAHGQGERLLEVLEKRLATNPEPNSQARLLADMADALDTSLGRGADALTALIKAINAMPGKLDLHDKARELAKRIGKTAEYVHAVDSTVDRLRRKDDPPLIANMLMRAGEALEMDAGDLRGAQKYYSRVEILGERLAEAFYAQARVAAALGDVAEQARTLDKMFELAGTDQSEPTPTQVDALYRLSEIFLGSESRKKQGFELLERAFAAEPRWGQAGRLLKIAAGNQPDDERVMSMYERVARQGGDQELLLDFLERRAALATATPAQIKEAVDSAVEQQQDARAEALLVRAVAAARETADGLGSAPWAVLALAERRLAAGDLEQARDLTYEIAPIVPAQDADGGSQVDNLAMRIATRALAHRKMQLAAEVYEFLRDRNPSERAVWQPLITIYRELGDGDRLSGVISSTLPNLITPAERNTLRLEHAKFLIEKLERFHDALDVVRDALHDDADNLEAAELYENTLRKLDDTDGIAEFLWSRFEDAQRRGHRDSTVDVALRLGDLLEKTGSPDVARVYRAALIVAPDDREILRRVVGQLGEHDNPREGAVLMERLLAVETPERAPELAGRLATMWEAAGDMRGVQRTLELAHGSAPEDTAIHDRLESWYRDHELWAELADLMTKDAERASDTRAVELLRETAAVYSGHLGQPLKAAEVLRKARLRAPHVAELVTDHAAALAAAGELDAAQRAIGEALATVQGAGRTALLLLRASFRQQLGDDASAVADLSEAYELDKDRVAETLVNGLEKLRARAERDGDMPTERTATLKLAQLLVAHGELERGRGFLVAWIERDPRDAEPLYTLCDLDESISHWDGVSAAATRLAYVTEGEAQVTAALRSATASTNAGRPAEAVPVLEMVFQAQPAIEVLRDKLREIYEAAGEYRLLTGILIADADHGSDPAQRYANYRRAAELLLYQLEDAPGAQVPAHKALELMPDDHAALMLNVDVLIQSGQVEVAGHTLETAIAAQKKRTPELAVLQQRMGRVSSMLGDKDGQLNWLKKAFDVDRKNAEVAAELAQLATEIGDYELALKPLRAITLMDNPSPVTRPMALLWEAKIEHARGNRAKAELWAKKALREDPAFADAQQFLDELGGA